MVHELVSVLDGPLLAAVAVGLALHVLHTLLAFVAFLVVTHDAGSATRLEAFRILVRALRPLPRTTGRRGGAEESQEQ